MKPERLDHTDCESYPSSRGLSFKRCQQEAYTAASFQHSSTANCRGSGGTARKLYAQVCGVKSGDEVAKCALCLSLRPACSWRFQASGGIGMGLHVHVRHVLDCFAAYSILVRWGRRLLMFCIASAALSSLSLCTSTSSELVRLQDDIKGIADSARLCSNGYSGLPPLVERTSHRRRLVTVHGLPWLVTKCCRTMHKPGPVYPRYRACKLMRDA